MSFGTVWKSSSYNYSNKKLTRLQYRKDIKNNIFGLTCSFCTLQGCKFYPRMGYLEPQSRACEAQRRNKSRRNEREKRKPKKRQKCCGTRSHAKGTGGSGSSSSLKLEQMVFVWLLVSLVIHFGWFAFSCSSASLGMTPKKIPSPRTVKVNSSTPCQRGPCRFLIGGTTRQSPNQAGGNETGSNTMNRETT